MRISDWSSDVCSSDLRHGHQRQRHAADERGGSGEMQQVEENAAAKQAKDDGRHSRKIVDRYLEQVGPAIARRIFLQIKRREHPRSEEHTSELQSLMRNSYAVICLQKKQNSIQCLENRN